MNIARCSVLFLVIVLVLLGAGATALAAESWVVDPATGGKIGWVSEGSTLAAAKWTGPFADGKAEGKGSLAVTLRGKDGKELKGTADAEMKAGKLDGKVVITWSEGDSYDGFYKEGLRDGKGVYRFADGRSYDGEWKAGNQSGKGVFRWKDGSIYEGDWQNGRMEGKGLYRYTDGTNYEGEFKNGIFEGKGIYRWPDGRTHEGEFKNNLPNGQGVLKDAAGKVLSQGEFRDGQLASPAAGQATSGRGKLTGFLGIAWGTERQEAEKIILARPDTRWFGDRKYNQFIGSFADQAGVLSLAYKDGKFASAAAWLPVSDDEVLPLFEKLKAQITDKYGKADEETGKYLDSKVQWNFPAASYSDCIAINITKTGFFLEDKALPAALRKPFAVVVHYVKGDVLVQQQQQQKQSGSKDI